DAGDHGQLGLERVRSVEPASHAHLHHGPVGALLAETVQRGGRDDLEEGASQPLRVRPDGGDRGLHRRGGRLLAVHARPLADALEVGAEERACAPPRAGQGRSDEPRDRALAVRARHQHDARARRGQAGGGQQVPHALQARPHPEALQGEEPVEGRGGAHVSSSHARISSAHSSPRGSWWCRTSHATRALPEPRRTISAPEAAWWRRACRVPARPRSRGSGGTSGAGSRWAMMRWTTGLLLPVLPTSWSSAARRTSRGASGRLAATARATLTACARSKRGIAAYSRRSAGARRLSAHSSWGAANAGNAACSVLTAALPAQPTALLTVAESSPGARGTSVWGPVCWPPAPAGRRRRGCPWPAATRRACPDPHQGRTSPPWQ